MIEHLNIHSAPLSIQNLDYSGYTSTWIVIFDAWISRIQKRKVNVKVNLSVCLTNHRAVRTYWRSGGIAPFILDLGTRWMWVVSFTLRPPYSQGKIPHYPLDRKLGGPQIGLKIKQRRTLKCFTYNCQAPLALSGLNSAWKHPDCVIPRRRSHWRN
jgi:hypothetical protein